MDTLSQIVINLVKTTPNDTDLGKKVRAVVQAMVTEQDKQSKNILKG